MLADRLGGDGNDNRIEDFERFEEIGDFESRGITGREMLTGSSFVLSGGSAGTGFGALWGRGAVSDFDGREGDLTSTVRW